MAIYYYSIIILENSPEDRALYCHYLNKNNLNKYTFIIATTGLEALSKIEQIKPDLILISDKLPDINIWEFLNQLTKWEIPIIMLGENDNATIAVKAMKNGVQDYLVKSKITSEQLCCAVNTVFKKRKIFTEEEIEINQQLQLSEQRFQAIFNNTFQFTGLLTIEGIVLEINETALKFCGLKSEDVINKHLWETYWWTISPDTQNQLKQAINRAAQGEFIRYEVEVLGAENKTAIIDFSIRPLRDETGKVIMLIPEGRDITDKKNLEDKFHKTLAALQDSEAEMRAMINAMVDVILVLDQEGRYLKIAPTNADQLYRPAKELIGKKVQEVLPLDLAEICINMVKKTLKTKQTSECEYSLDINNKTVWFSAKVSPISAEKVIWVARDITASKESDIIHQKAEQALQESEETFRQFTENSKDVILVREVESGKLLYVNPAYTEIWGQSLESLYENSNSWKNSIHPDDIQSLNHQYQIIGKNKFLNAEYRIIRPDKSIRWIWGRCFPICNSHGEVYRIGTIAQDITERKQTHEERDRLLKKLELQNQTLEEQINQRTDELQQSEKRFRNLVETSSDWVWEINEHGVYTYASPQIFNILGYFPTEIIGKTPFDLMPSEEAEKVLKEFTKYASIQLPFQCLENINRHKDGRLITLETSGMPIFDVEQNFRGYRGMDRDITARKQIEQTLRQNEDRFQRIVRNAPGVMYQYLLHPDQSHEFIYISDHALEIYEIEPEKILTDINYLFQIIHPEDLPKLQESIAYSAKSLQQWSWEGRIITKSGKIKWIQCIAEPDKQANGNILWDGLVIDITERKQIEVAFRNLSNRLDLAIKSAQIGIWDWDIINDFLIWDRRMYEIYGLEPSTLGIDYQTWEQHLHPEDLEDVRIAIQKALNGEEEFEQEFRIICSDGKIKFINAYALVEKNSQNKPERMIGLNFDISDRKRKELENKRLKERLEFLLSASPAVIYTCPASNKFQATFISKNVHHVIGYPKEKWLEEENFWLNRIHPEDLNQLFTQLNHLEEQEYHLYQYRFCNQNGHYRWIEDEFRLIRDKNGQPLEIIGYLVDITEQKAALQERELAEAEIIRSRDLREAIFNESADALFLVDIETIRTIDCNQRAVEMFAANSRNDLIGIEGHTLQKQQFTPEEIQSIMDEMKIHGVWSREIEYKTFQGDEFWGSLAAKDITVGSQKMNLVRVSDISQRKLIETQLQENNKQLATFNEELARATRLKDEFLANMSHELRTPLNAILGLSESLQDSNFGVINEKQRQSLQTIERSGQHLLELINDILDLSKIESGHINLDFYLITINNIC